MDLEDYEKITQSLADVTYHLRRNYFAEDSDMEETNDRLNVEIDYLLGLIQKTRLGKNERIIFSYRQVDLERDLIDAGINPTNKNVESCADYLFRKQDYSFLNEEISLSIDTWNELNKEGGLEYV